MSLNEELQTITGIGEAKAEQIEAIVRTEYREVHTAKIRQAYRMLQRGNKRAAKDVLEPLIND